MNTDQPLCCADLHLGDSVADGRRVELGDHWWPWKGPEGVGFGSRTWKS